MELAKSLDPGKTPKTDKASIVADAIRVVTQLRTENSQLQQLNKFLEVRSDSKTWKVQANSFCKDHLLPAPAVTKTIQPNFLIV